MAILGWSLIEFEFRCECASGD